MGDRFLSMAKRVFWIIAICAVANVGQSSDVDDLLQQVIQYAVDAKRQGHLADVINVVGAFVSRRLRIATDASSDQGGNRTPQYGLGIEARRTAKCITNINHDDLAAADAEPLICRLRKELKQGGMQTLCSVLSDRFQLQGLPYSLFHLPRDTRRSMPAMGVWLYERIAYVLLEIDPLGTRNIDAIVSEARCIVAQSKNSEVPHPVVPNASSQHFDSAPIAAEPDESFTSAFDITFAANPHPRHMPTGTDSPQCPPPPPPAEPQIGTMFSQTAPQYSQFPDSPSFFHTPVPSSGEENPGSDW
jgi:hypothetical protein